MYTPASTAVTPPARIAVPMLRFVKARMNKRMAANINAVPRAACANPNPEMKKRDWLVADEEKAEYGDDPGSPQRRSQEQVHHAGTEREADRREHVDELIRVQPEDREQPSVDRSRASGVNVRRQQPEEGRDIGGRMGGGVGMASACRRPWEPT